MKLSVLQELAKRPGDPVIVNMQTDNAALTLCREAGMQNIPPMLYIYKTPSLEWMTQPRRP